MTSIRRRFARPLLAVARSPLGGRLAALACARLPRLLPVERLALTPEVIAFRHPRPESRDHVVLVPRAYLPSLTTLIEDRRHDLLLALLAVATPLAASRTANDAEERLLAINLGGRQDVSQLHAHLMPASGLRSAIEQVIEEHLVDARDSHEVLRILDLLARRVEVAGGPWGGSILIRDLAASVAGRICLSATVTPPDQRPPLR